MNRRSLLLRLGGLGAAVAGGLWLRDQVIWKRPRIVVRDDGWRPWDDPGTDAPTAAAAIGGRRVRALIDSGAEYSAVDRRLVEALGLAAGFNMPMVAYGVGGRPQMGRGVTLSLEAGGLAVGRLQAAVLDLGPLASDAGRATPLVLGQDVLNQVVIEIDQVSPRRTGRRLRFLPAGAAQPADAGALEARRAGRALKMPVEVEGRRFEALVDTGSSAALALSEALARQLGLLDGRPARPGASLVLGGVTASRIVRARGLAVAGAALGEAEVSVFATPRLPGFPSALIGMAAFAGRRVRLDLAGGRASASRPLDLTVG